MIHFSLLVAYWAISSILETREVIEIQAKTNSMKGKFFPDVFTSLLFLGRYETEHSDPMAGMSDEQKEYEAMQLLNAMDRLQRLGMKLSHRISFKFLSMTITNRTKSAVGFLLL